FPGAQSAASRGGAVAQGCENRRAVEMDVDRNFSSSATLLYKFVFPAIWIALCGMFAFQLSRITPPAGASGNAIIVGLLLVWAAGSVFFLRVSLPLLRVQLR